MLLVDHIEIILSIRLFAKQRKAKLGQYLILVPFLLYSYACFWVFLIFVLSLFLFNRFLPALKDTPENFRNENEVARKQSDPDINSEVHDKKELNTCLVSLAERSSETKVGPGIPEQQPPLKPRVEAKAVLSPLTLFLLGTDTLRTFDPVYEKKLRGKHKRWLNKALKLRRKPYVCCK